MSTGRNWIKKGNKEFINFVRITVYARKNRAKRNIVLVDFWQSVKYSKGALRDSDIFKVDGDCFTWFTHCNFNFGWVIVHSLKFEVTCSISLKFLL